MQPCDLYSAHPPSSALILDEAVALRPSSHIASLCLLVLFVQNHESIVNERQRVQRLPAPNTRTRQHHRSSKSSTKVIKHARTSWHKALATLRTQSSQINNAQDATSLVATSQWLLLPSCFQCRCSLVQASECMTFHQFSTNSVESSDIGWQRLQQSVVHDPVVSCF